MAVDPKSEEGQTLRKLFPLVTMPARQYNALCSEINVTETAKGSFLFRQGEAPDSFIYLLQGSVSLEAEEFKVEIISAGTDAAQFAIAHQFPRQISARAVDNVRYVSLQLNAFDKQEAEDIEEESDYMVENEGDTEQEASGDWMSALLKSPVFQRLPAMNLQQVLISLDEVEFSKGDVIFRQGDSGDYYYLVRKGRCALSRKASDRGKEIKLLELGENETFGEDALLSGEPRSMTITAMTDMTLSRIDKERFVKLIKEPALKYIDYHDLLNERDHNQDLTIVDIRAADEYKKSHIKGSQNIPFFSLRIHVKDLKKQSKKIALVCANGTLSEAAAFVLIKSRVDAVILLGGMQSFVEEPEKVEAATFSIDESDDAEKSHVIASVEPDVSESLELDQITEDDPINKEVNNLEQENQALKAENKRLMVDIEKVKRQYKMLYTQTEKLKAAFDKLQATK